jgi:hypothetical protein
MKKGYSSKQKQIYQDYVLYGNESLLEILRNKDDHPSATIKVIKDILEERETGSSSAVQETGFEQRSSEVYSSDNGDRQFPEDTEKVSADTETKFIKELRDEEESELDKIILRYTDYIPEKIRAALFVSVEKGIMTFELKESLLIQIDANLASQSKWYKQKKWETKNAFVGYVSRYQDDEIYNLIEDPKGIVIDVYHAILLTGLERELISQADFDEYFRQAESIIRSDSEVKRDEFYDLFDDTKPLSGYETDAALEAEAEKFWICPSCDETVGIELDVCWNCQAKMPEVIEHPEREVVIKEIRARQQLSPVKSGLIAIGIGLFVGLIESTGNHIHYYRLVMSGILVLAGVFLVITSLFSKSKGKI